VPSGVFSVTLCSRGRFDFPAAKGKQGHQELAKIALAQSDLSRPISSAAGMNQANMPQTCLMTGNKPFLTFSKPELTLVNRIVPKVSVRLTMASQRMAARGVI
jgi:hypothetical protein